MQLKPNKRGNRCCIVNLRKAQSLQIYRLNIDDDTKPGSLSQSCTL